MIFDGKIIHFLLILKVFNPVESMLAKYFNWTYYSGSYFLFIPTEMNFTRALSTCSSYEAYLLSIESADRNNFIASLYLNSAPNGIWLALYDFIGIFFLLFIKKILN
jgi:hypothetical protein